MSAGSLRDASLRLFRYNILAFAARLVTSAVIARTMGPAGMGVWLLLMLITSYAEGFVRIKADAAAVYVLGRGGVRLGEVCTALHVIALVTGGVAALVLYLAEPWVVSRLFSGGEVDLVLYRTVLLLIPLIFLGMNYSYLLLHLEDMHVYKIHNFFSAVFPSMTAAALMLLTPWRLGALVAATFCGVTAALAVSAYAVHRRDGLRLPRRRAVYTSLLRHARPLYFAGMVEHLNQYLASLLVGLHLSSRDLSFFRLGQDRLQVLDQVPSSLGTVLFPRFAKLDDAAVRHDLVARSCRLMALLMVLSGIGFALVAPAFVWILYGAAYWPMVAAIWLLLPGVVTLGASAPAVQYFMGSGRSDLVWKIALVPLAVQGASLVPAIMAFGYRGAAGAVSVSFVVHAATRFAVLARVTGRPLHAVVLPTRSEVSLVTDVLFARVSRIARRFGPRKGLRS